ncbi:competence type IV pilus major pilin ComGC [Marinilactibacillus sp. Marseille-P9653]|uniref:competence type IV pilus major pilin ComGC n=1 Tax=Marinilactibacillus sp. Marseille-P9653 TaxID=2866583 RepID=UPI001CE48F39|nr:prepilin-type N-terminal cleavage/methylation domain-containing protein [Marinilactibacillus sp. Marseille-P9653]
MRNQIKKLIKKENGFTLVELLAVLVILGIIVAIAIPAIGNVVENANGKAETAEEALVIDAARLYDIEHTIGSTGVTVETLKTEGYLEIRDSESLSDSTTVTVKTEGKQKTYVIE